MIAEIKVNGTRNVRAYSIDLKDYVEFSLDDEKGPKASWARYIFGVCREMMALGIPVEGFNTHLQAMFLSEQECLLLQHWKAYMLLHSTICSAKTK